MKLKPRAAATSASITIGGGWPSRRAQAFKGPLPPWAFSLIEVMIACGIFFMATFAILSLVSTTLRNARALQRGDVDAGMAAAQIYQTLRTNRQVEFSGSGDFGQAYPDYSYEFSSQQYQSNGLLQVDIIVNRRGLRKPVDALSIWVYNPDAKPGFGPRF
jgi:hypothetical protein